jgi:hypothetical protein
VIVVGVVMLRSGLFGIMVAEIAQNFRQRRDDARVALAFHRRARGIADAVPDILDLQRRGLEEGGNERGAAAGPGIAAARIDGGTGKRRDQWRRRLCWSRWRQWRQ